jgi:dTDP-glucose pyrophosphorylase
MKIIIAAAGRGTRMKNLTANQPKHLIKVLDKPFLFYLLKNIKKAGYKNIIVIGGYKIEKLKEFISQYDTKIKLVNQYKKINKKYYGTACTVRSIQHLVKKEDFIFLAGDNLYSVKDLKRIKKLDHGFCYVCYKNHKFANKYGVLKTRKNILQEIIEKPKKFVSHKINVSLYKFTPEIFSAIKNVRKSARGEYEIIDAINLLAQKKKVKVAQVRDYWYDFGCPEDIKKIEKFLKP